VREEFGQSFSLSANDYDLSFLAVDNFTVSIQRHLFMRLISWDNNDTYNYITLHHYSWEGDSPITYEYEYAPASEDAVAA
jgi:hypothetical protein